VIARILVAVLLTGSALAQGVVHYTTTNANVKYLFATAEPVLHLKSGDILDTNTLDCFGNGLKKPGDTLSMAKGDNPLAGPFFVEGAEPGDTLAVKILDLQVDGDMGVGAFSPGFGSINSSHYTPMLGGELPERVWFYPIDHGANAATFNSALSDNYTTGTGALVDADMNQASTRLQALQTQQQLGVQSLSIANQSSQLILKLFQ